MNINFFTATFPYLSSEPFIENEIPIIARNVDAINIFPYEIGNALNCRTIPSNCSTFKRNETRLNLSGREYFTLTRLIANEFFLTQKKYYFLKNLRTWVSLGKKAIITAKSLSSLPEINNRNVCYSYWMNDWALALTVLKMQKKIPAFVFRTLGFDIWDSRSPGDYLPFRGVIYKYASAIYPNSQSAAIYLRKKNLFANKIKCMYLGTIDHGLATFDSGNTFTIVSCSHVIPLKRVNLIIEIISFLNFKVNWIHIGNGGELNNVMELSKKLNQKHNIEFKGYLNNDSFYDFFKNTSINLFITTSSTEGLPVSLQEAISFGIPCVATDVGGISEVVNHETGILIPKDFDPRQVAKEIERFESSERNSIEYRKKVRLYWQNKFTAVANYDSFIHELMNIKN